MPKKTRAKKRLRLIMEFENKAQLLQMVDELWDLFPAGKKFAAYSCDCLDDIKPDERTYWLRHIDERPESYRLK